MGKRGGKKQSGGARGGRRPARRADYREVLRENVNYEKYYNSLDIVGDDEREDFWASLRRDLPNSFRFAGSKGHALSVQRRLIDHYIPEIVKIDHDGDKVEAPFPISWYPDQLAWAMNTPKNIIRRFPPFASFQKFLVSETSVGNISRQEAVSMIPPLLLDIKSGMTVLDMCAAPGSKAAQVMEMLHNGEEARVRQIRRKLAAEEGRELSPDGFEVEVEKEEAKTHEDWADDGRSTGLLVANDSDYKRSHLLVHQMKRLNSPNLIVTNHDATMYPSIRIPSAPTPPGKIPQPQYLKFDRILADVPCSGDGTPRKNVNVWNDWSPASSLGLYSTQVRLLVRALQMLKVGGRVVYSTCSMNPVENEAVIASAIDRCGGATQVHIIDCSDQLPALKRKPGLESWKVMSKAGRLWDSWAEVEKAREEEGPDGLGRLAEGMFPPSKKIEEETQNGHTSLLLSRCMRIYGHQQDTGAFFIAVLEKKFPIKARPESEPKKGVPKPPITAIADEVSRKTDAGETAGVKIDAIDDVLPPNPQNEGTVSASARQNKENAPNEVQAGVKRPLDQIDEADAAMGTKRLRTRDQPEEAAPVGEEDRQVHWPPPPAANPTASGPEPPNQKKGGQPFEEPFKYLAEDHEELQEIYKFYQLSDRFPRDRFMVRNATGEPVKTIYYTATLARDILKENEGKGIKFVHCGVKMFVAQDVQRNPTCKWRIQTEGMPLLESWVGEDRVVRLYRRETLRRILIEMFPKVGGDGWCQLGEIGERVRDIEPGCCVLRIETSDAEDGFKERMVLPLWRSMYSLNLMLPKEDRRAMLLRIFNDDSPLENTHTHSRPVPVAPDTRMDDDGPDDPPATGLKDGVAEAAAMEFVGDELDANR
ncbi:MAG: hypothetical protein M4579_000795 [Chaenotheca gracillima]|nr:MAG: hypothetical protein M4579_000795 [Chaenotheca gracillima]